MKVTNQMIHDWKNDPITKEVLKYLKNRAENLEDFGKGIIQAVPSDINNEVKAKIHFVAGSYTVLTEILSGGVFDAIIAEGEENEDSTGGVQGSNQSRAE